MAEKTVHVHFCYKDRIPTSCLADLDQSKNASIFAGLDAAGWPEECGESRMFWNNTYSEDGMNLLVVSLGEKNAKDYCEIEMLNEKTENARVAAGAAINALKGLKIQKVVMEEVEGCNMALAEGAFLAQHRYKDSDKDKMPLDIAQAKSNSDWETGKNNATAQNFARTLMETPANLMTPTIFAQRVTDTLEPLGVKCTTYGSDFIKNERMGAFWCIAKGSIEEPKMLKLEWNGPTPANGKTICLVGKGVTFDAGGISIKPSANMDAMRADMGGAAVSVSTVYAAAMNKMSGRLVCLTPLAENMPSGTAVKPGDVVTARNGTTIQVDNTDAEGRMLMCDTLCYACDTIKPDVLIDSATLTGAMCVATGWACAGCFTWSKDLANQLIQAGESTGDRIWRMPVFKSHKSKIAPAQLADINNTGPRYGGACNAAAFLRHFVPADGPEYAHLDIAGVMDTAPGCTDPSYLAKGMTGRPCRTLYTFCSNYFQ